MSAPISPSLAALSPTSLSRPQLPTPSSSNTVPPPSPPHAAHTSGSTTAKAATAASTTTPGTRDFPFPAHYSFPPFFTLQPNAQTRASQLASWSTLIQSYCRHHRLFSLVLVDALETPLFHHARLRRRLAARDAGEIVAWMCSREGGQRAEWIGGGTGGDGAGGGPEGEAGSVGVGSGPGGVVGELWGGRKGKERSGRVWIYWRRPEEWGVAVEEWVERTGQKGTVLTLYELLESDATIGQGEWFHFGAGHLRALEAEMWANTDAR
jgi:ESCRT-II complex subunit VPS25